MSLASFLISHIKLTFVADKPPTPQFAHQDILMSDETGSKYFSWFSSCQGAGPADFRRFLACLRVSCPLSAVFSST
jgi:hypothetical protein